MSLDFLRVYTPPAPKTRVGKPHGDGGYVVIDLPDVKYDVLIAGGVADQVEFEDTFLERWKIPCYAYDGTINGNFPETKHPITFVGKNIGPVETATETNLHNLFDAHEHIFVKMDIEGAEYPWFRSLSDAQLEKIEQMVIELHPMHDFSQLERLARTHWLVHVHGNNYGGLMQAGDIILPAVFECTFIRKKEGQELELNTQPFPTEFDQPNTRDRPDYTV
jgi:hypothetical protein